MTKEQTPENDAPTCEDFRCDGEWQVQGWTDKNGYSEDQYGRCSRPCGRVIPPEGTQP